MKILSFIFILFLSLGCKPEKQNIQFEVSYTIDPNHLSIEDNQLVIHDFPLHLQANAEKNYSKKSQVNTVQLIAIESNVALDLNTFSILNRNNWEKVYENPFQQNHTTSTHKYRYALLNKGWNYVAIFKDKGLLTMKINKMELNINEDILLKLTFRMKGKLDKTNMVYRIVG